MKRIAVLGDSHFNEASRFDECIRIHDWIATDIEEREVDLVLHAGDIFEHKSSIKEREAVANWLNAITQVAPIVIVRGNHDACGDLKLFERLDALNPIFIEEMPEVRITNGIAIACLPWPRKAELLSHLQSIGHEQSEAVGQELIRNVNRGLGDQMAGFDGPKILLAHAMVSGSKVSTGQTLVGCDFELGLEDMALARADFVAMGHIHKSQRFEFDEAPIIYTGSPRRCNFGEMEEKSYVVAEFEKKELVNWYHVPTPATPMQHISGDWIVDEWIDSENKPVLQIESIQIIPGSELRLRYTVDADQREAARSAAEEWSKKAIADGAISVKLEEVVRPTTRARAPEIAKAATLKDKLIAYWKAKQIEPDETRAAKLFDKLNILEAA